MTEVVQIINNVGFPIACVIGMGFYIYKVQSKMMEIVQNNTKAIENLIDKINDLK